MKAFALPLSMLAGALSYFILHSLPLAPECRSLLLRGVEILQPMLIFAMLFLTFCKVPLKSLRPSKWHIYLLLVQGLSIIALVLLRSQTDNLPVGIMLETALICMICPTATAAAVITGRLGGNVAGLTSYLILVNLLVAVLFPLFIPLIANAGELSFFMVFGRILGKLFPVLLLPIICAELCRHFATRLHAWFSSRSGWTFRIWLVSLALAIALSTHSIVSMRMSLAMGFCIAITSLLCCALQFLVGRKIGAHFGGEIAAQQALGQKNTTLAIWMAYTFLNPFTTVAGGFYSIWHNLFNTWQLGRIGKQ